MANSLTTSPPMLLAAGFAGQAVEFFKRSAVTWVLAGIAIALHLASDLTPWFTLEFSRLSPIGLYRLVTCHWLHWSANHLAWDVAMFAVLGSLCERRSRWCFLATLLASVVAIPLVVMTVHPELGSYRGLSGIDTALFGLLVADHFMVGVRTRNWGTAGLFGLMGLALFGKIALEILAQGNLFVSDTSFTPVPLAHLVGAMIGLAIGSGSGWNWWAGLRVKDRRKPRPSLGNC